MRASKRGRGEDGRGAGAAVDRPTRILIAGVGGRMGAVIAREGARMASLLVVGGFGRAEAEAGGPDDGRLRDCDVVVDFSTALAAGQLAERLMNLAKGGSAPAMVIGATGFTPVEEAMIVRAAGKVAIVKAANFSIGLNLLITLARRAASQLPATAWDIEVIEAHHRRKRDAPSGSALALAAAAAAGRGVNLEAVRAAAPTRQGPRVEGEIGFAVVRGGGLAGEHRILFAAENETLTLGHSARSRETFARGALQAASWVARRRAGLYDVGEAFGIEAAGGVS